MAVETDDDVRFKNNLIGDYRSYLQKPANGNLHLTEHASLAIDQGRKIPTVQNDIDKQPRENAYDIGADEYKP
jgi:hypothetical protein